MIEIDNKQLTTENARLEHELAELKAGLEEKYKSQLDTILRVAEGQDRMNEEKDKRIGELLQERRDFAMKFHELGDKFNKFKDELKLLTKQWNSDRTGENHRYSEAASLAMKMSIGVEQWKYKDTKTTKADCENKAFYHLGAASVYQGVQNCITDALDKYA